MDQYNIKKISALLKNTSIPQLLSKNKPKKLILTYHGISSKNQFNCITQKLFERQMCWLNSRFHVVPLEVLVESLKDSCCKEKDIVSITFDDGYINFSEYALPIIEKYGFHATLFVPSGKVGSYNDWDVGLSSFEKLPIMTFRNLIDLQNSNVEIGSHGISHSAFSTLSLKDSLREISVSRLDLEQRIGQAVRFFSFPYGDMPVRHKVNCLDALSQYAGVCTTKWGRFNAAKDIYSLKRVGVWEKDTMDDFIDKIEGCYDWLEWKEAVGRLSRSSLSRLKGIDRRLR